MVFSSIAFLYYFLPAALLLYWAAPRHLKNAALLVVSLFFYFYGEPVYTLLLVFSAVSDYLHSRYIERHRGRKRAGIALASSIAINLGMLGVFKYGGFGLALPVGISFFTFQTMSYTIDVHRGEVKAEKGIVPLAAYVAMFPQLVAGPIVRYKSIAEQLRNRRHGVEGIAAGMGRFVVGLGKKVLLANRFAEFCGAYRAADSPSVLYHWAYAVAFSLQLYFDFSGYSDMAIGLGRIFGFAFPENFNYPYISRSVTEFWRRWHMTLGSWFRDYVYIPLGGNRGGKPRWIRNILAVWLLTGLWHGAAWNFVLWGLYFGVLLVFEKSVGLGWLGRLPLAFRHGYVLLAVLLGFVAFNGEGMQGMVEDLGGLFGGNGLPFFSAEAAYQLRSHSVLFLAGAIGATPLPKRMYLQATGKGTGKRMAAFLEPLAMAALFLAATAYLVDGSFNPFLYFRF
ncbi:MBOAT family O-acyltransferase [Anaerotalea alkaliphila]|uniref:MBOAT family protein n=1 Tax=Anaerotalea alkaliphila TaxID=2662126 RepID=A0A7X5HUR7_9FIRM|nr:MBOAT family protein [Anaerotalea alkaliphila]NDL67056.1 MBOAT family protein [Anaerotalea alkaliphila]